MQALKHYASQVVALEPRRPAQKPGLKPHGFWVSVGTEWLDWCRSERYGGGVPWFEHDVNLKPSASILYLNSAFEVREFSNEYGAECSPAYPSKMIGWDRVQESYDGIIISPYQWSCRLDSDTFWYYGWDVASGCIWSPDVLTIGEGVRIEFGEDSEIRDARIEAGL